MFIVNVIAAPPEVAAVVSVPAAVVSVAAAVVSTAAGVVSVAAVPAVVSFALLPSLPQAAATKANPTANAA
ncbi:MAG: hypothetical protein ABI862_04975 [Ilumatobacteraceae bacterium]